MQDDVSYEENFSLHARTHKIPAYLTTSLPAGAKLRKKRVAKIRLQLRHDFAYLDRFINDSINKCNPFQNEKSQSNRNAMKRQTLFKSFELLECKG